MIKELIQLSQNTPLKSYHSTKDWSVDYYELVKDQTPIHKAIFGGFSCQQFSFAFMAGYQAALEKMFPTVAPNELKALCVSEAKGGHPKFMQTTLYNQQIKGVKTYVTAGSDAAHLLVLCKTKEQVNGKPLLKIVHLPQNAKNIEVTDFDLPFMLDVKHGKVALKDCIINPSQILAGDGYNQYTKPFRTFEDICIGASYQAMLLRQAIDNNWADDLRDQLLLNIYTLKNLLTLAPSDKETHLLLASMDAQFANLLPSIDVHIANHTTAAFQADWKVNKRVVSLGEKMKELRLSKARTMLFKQ